MLSTSRTAPIARRPKPSPPRRSTHPVLDGQRFDPLANFRPDLPPTVRNLTGPDPRDMLLEERNEPLGASAPTGFVSSPPSRTVCHVSSPRPSGPGCRRSQGRLCRLVASALHKTNAQRTFPHVQRRRPCSDFAAFGTTSDLDAQECLTGILSAHTGYCNNSPSLNVHPVSGLHRIERNARANRSGRASVPIK